MSTTPSSSASSAIPKGAGAARPGNFLFGRTAELRKLEDALERACRDGKEFAFLLGESGIGKSAILQELAPALRSRGVYGAAKFEAGVVSGPRAALMHALRGILRTFLALPREELARKRAVLAGALAGLAGALVPSLPELETILGPPAALPQLEPANQRSRFEFVFLRLLGALGSDSPLILCLDDMQWADADTLGLLAAWIGDPGPGKGLLLGSVRTGDGPLAAWEGFRESLRPSGRPGAFLVVERLEAAAVQAWVEEAAGGPDQGGLAGAVWKGTMGHPMHVRQYLDALRRHKYAALDPGGNRLVFRFREGTLPEGGVPSRLLLQQALEELSPRGREFLEAAGCVGFRFTPAQVSHAIAPVPGEWPRLLREFMSMGLLREPEAPYPGSPTAPEQEFAFAHDQVRDALRAGLAPGKAQAMHLALGMGLWSGGEPEGETLFQVCGHLNAAEPLLADAAVRARAARLNLKAANYAKASTAFSDAYRHCRAALALLPRDAWAEDYGFALELHLLAAETGYMEGRDSKGEEQDGKLEMIFSAIDANRRTLADGIPAIETRIQFLITRNRLRESIEYAKGALAALGLRLPRKPNRLHAMQAVLAMQARLYFTDLDGLLGQAEVAEDDKRSIERIMSRITSAVFLHDAPLAPLLMIAQLRLSLGHGRNSNTAFAYSMYGLILCGVLHRYEQGARFGKLALEMHSRHGRDQEKAKVMFGVHHFVTPWKLPLDATLADLEAGWQCGLKTGDVEFSGHLINVHAMTMLHAGKELGAIQALMEPQFGMLRALRQERALNIHRLYLKYVASLRSGDEDREGPPERGFASMLRAFALIGDAHGAALTHLLLLIRSVQDGDFDEARRAGEKVASLLESLTGTYFTGWFRCYFALALAGGSGGNPGWRERLRFRAQLGWLRSFAKHAPGNYLHKLHLAEGESHRMGGRSARAKEAYAKAIDAAHRARAVDEEALAWGYLFRMHRASGESHLAGICLENQLACLQRWGAGSLASSLRERYRSSHPAAVRAFAEAPAAADLRRILSVSHALAAEKELPPLLARLMAAIVEMTGAHRACLVTEEGGAFRILAERREGKADIPGEGAEAARLPLTMLRLAAHTGEAVRLGAQGWDGFVAQDAYFLAREIPSALCIPLKYQGRTEALLYLENRESVDAFPEADPWMGWLGGQAAISLRSAQFREQRMTALRARIDPHFLFNALLTIAHLTRAEPQAAEAGVIQLANLYRALLENSHRDLIPLEREIACVAAYLAIEKLRFGERLEYRIEIEPGLEKVEVPALTVQPLVENAVKYGVAPKVGKGTILVSAKRQGGSCLISVANDGAGWGKGMRGTGEGIANIRERLKLAFGDQGDLKYLDSSGIEAVLSFPADPPLLGEKTSLIFS